MSGKLPEKPAGNSENAETAGIDGNAGEAETDGTARTAQTARIAHIGIAVRNLDEALRLYHDTLGLPLHGRETVESDRVTVAFLPIGDTQVELLEATDPESPVARFIEKRGEGVHHVAFEVDDVDEALEILREQGFRLIDETPRAGAGGARVAFVHPRTTNGVLIELCEKDADRQ